jgi:hypothetical protein
VSRRSRFPRSPVIYCAKFYGNYVSSSLYPSAHYRTIQNTVTPCSLLSASCVVLYVASGHKCKIAKQQYAYKYYSAKLVCQLNRIHVQIIKLAVMLVYISGCQTCGSRTPWGSQNLPGVPGKTSAMAYFLCSQFHKTIRNLVCFATADVLKKYFSSLFSDP